MRKLPECLYWISDYIWRDSWVPCRERQVWCHMLRNVANSVATELLQELGQGTTALLVCFHTIKNHLGWKTTQRSWRSLTQHYPFHCYTMFPSTTSTHLLNISKDGDSNTCLSSLFKCLATLLVKKKILKFKICYATWTSTVLWGQMRSIQEQWRR